MDHDSLIKVVIPASSPGIAGSFAGRSLVFGAVGALTGNIGIAGMAAGACAEAIGSR